MKLTVLALILGFVIDLILGDPHGLPHPVVFIGRLISLLEKELRKRFPATASGERTAGAVLWILVALVSFLVPWLILRLLGWISPWVRLIGESLMCWQILATRSLRVESMKVYTALETGTLADARKAVSMIVGRDTAYLDDAGVTRAAVETVAENTSDGVVAPFFWMALFGAAGGLFYKAINTMDSMVGYKNEKYLSFGRFAARFDDVVNYIPARLSALAMIGAAFLLKLDGKNAFRIWRRDRRNHASPNSAQCESACAGALGVQLGGNASYFGQVYEKPTIGDPTRPIEGADVNRACRLMYGTSVLALLLYGVILLLGGAL